MLPAALVDATIEALEPRLKPGDIIIDGGNSYYRDDVDRAKRLSSRGLHYVDCGTSGGVWGLERGYCLMIGGEPDVVKHLDPIFATLAPGGDVRLKPDTTPIDTGDEHRAARVSALRSARRRTLRQDGAQRHRVRLDGRLRRRLQHPQARQRRQDAKRRRPPSTRRCATRSTTSSISICRRSPKCGVTAAWCRRGCSI